MPLSFSLLMLIMLIIRSLYVANANLSGNGLNGPAANSAGGRERTQRCWATRTTGVPDVSSPVKNFTPGEFMLTAGAYSWYP